MKTWKIKAVSIGHFRVDKSIETLMTDIGTVLDLPTWVYAIYDDEKKILVDTGVHSAEDVEEITGGAYYLKEEETLANRLENTLGWKAEDVEMVIHTHMHYDHVGNDALFKNAEFYVQRSEYEQGFHPIPTQTNIYRTKYYGPEAVNYFQWRLLDGETQILPGIAVIPTPGHSIGHQSVLVNTEEGVVCISGDACNMSDNLWRNLAPAFVVSVEDAVASMAKIRSCAVRFVCGHEPGYENGQEGGFPFVDPEKN